MIRYVIGLSGGVGSGKSLVARLFGKWGARVIDADAAGHRVIDLPRIRAGLVRDWGREILRGGRVDRAALARRAFASPAAAARLNRRVHPEILRRIRKALAGSKGRVVLDAALLYETGADALCDRVVFVHAPRAVRDRRLRARGWAPGERVRRERFQWPVSRKRKRADDVVDNTGSRSRTERQIRKIWDEIRPSE